MQSMVLGDHVGEQIRNLELGRELELQERLSVWRKQAAAVDGVNRRRRVRLARAWRERRWAGIVWFGLDRAFRGDKQYPARPRIARPGRTEIVWREGEVGEQRVVERLAGLLDDSWTLLQGYRNPRGEIDQILVGPGGVHAIEVKNKNGVIHCQGDRWYVDRYDNYGNCVERNLPFRDGGGRSPARQLSDPCRMLAGYLRKPLPDVHIKRHVVLSHPKSRIGKLKELTIDSVCTLGERGFQKRFTDGTEQLDEATVARLVKLIEKSHKRAGKLNQSGDGRLAMRGREKQHRPSGRRSSAVARG